MDAQELRNLQEAYMEVVENQQLDEGYKIYSNRKVQDKMDKLKSKGDLESVGRAGQIRDKLIKRSFSSQIPDKEEKLNRNKSEKYKRSKTVSDNTEKKKSFPNRLTRSDKQGIRDSYDYYDIILSHLLDEGYAETPAAAETIMVNMSEEWKDSIVEEVEQLDEISLKTKMSAYARSQDPDADYQYGSKVHAQGDRIKKAIVKKHGEKAGEHAERHADAEHWGRKDASGKRKGLPKPRIQKNRDYRTTKAGKMHGQDQSKLKRDLKYNRFVED